MDMNSEDNEHDIVALNYLTTAQIEARYLSLTDAPPPRPLSRALLITAVAYETVRKTHRERMIANGHMDANHARR